MPETSNVDYSTKIPNNVGLMDDQRVLKALEQWHPGYIDWWMTMGPEGFQTSDVYLRTAISIDPKGWAKFDYVKMPEYRWGILLAPRQEDRQVNFGTHKGEKAWQEVPGEYRAMLRRLIVIQGDTEPASVEQQRHLGKTAPSLYDMRNLFQVNVEEGRHLWAMVYLLQKYFGKDGREEAEGLLQRRSGDADKPRMLGAFNEATPDWLSFFMFTFFTDRDGKMQLESLAQSGFDPLSRTCRFMLTEEAHHMFVGETGVGRAIERTCQAMKAGRHRGPLRHRRRAQARRHRPADHAEEGQPALLAVARPVRLGGLDQRRQLLQLPASRAASRRRASRTTTSCTNATYPVSKLVDGQIKMVDEPALTAINMRLRDDYVADCAKGVERWNKVIEKAGIKFRLELPHVAFHRHIGEFAERQGVARRRGC